MATTPTPTLVLDPILSITINNNEDQTHATGEKKEKRKKGPTYQEHEDAQICCSWIEVSKDPKSGPIKQPAQTRPVTRRVDPTHLDPEAKAFVQEANQEACIMKDMALSQANIASQLKRQNNIYQSQTQTMQTMANTEIMNKDLSGLDEVTQEFYRLQREQIMLKL
ncbi:hypothetical protein PGT21_026276 [Puccinia graminis f. sp. tritici]|uniref:No apical meristem-associated C-terminal domain-containing protein n=1 Tax=Puccinia graminis f. sp. tritici TaxID=56615 RepID=A0A5B0QL26_PUCGR|nr:hypothetical protein PGT21_026276 [Puccinia graminis f. sp. tritici]KAA1113822.1 hypothetical protein PGTUg99_024810 [Puccinia graminis f. sp. tritici]